MKKNYNFINNYKIELIVILILIVISIGIYYVYKKYNSYEQFTTTTAITKDNWIQLGLDINGQKMYEYSGNSVALSSDGTIIAIGDYNNDNNGIDSGRVRMYQWVASSWTQLGNDINGAATNDLSGFSIALSSDGTIVAIGAPFNDANGTNSGHVKIYQWINNSWTQRGTTINGKTANDKSGYSIALSSDGTIVAIGAPYNNSNGTYSGHVRLFKWINNSWSQLGNDINGKTANDQSGKSVALSSDGTIVAIGAPYNNSTGTESGHVRMYQWVAGSWTQLGNDINGTTANELSGNSIALSSDGTIVAIGAYSNDGNGTGSGNVRMYQWVAGTWTQLGNAINGVAANDQSGLSIALSSDGTIVAIGAPFNDGNGTDSGHVRMYQWVARSWTQFGNDIKGEASGDNSGNSVALSSEGKIVAIGASNNDGNGTNSGHVRIYTSPPPINCVGDFVNSGECSKTCGGGKQKQIYKITTPSQYGGALCNIDEGVEKYIDCNTQPCLPINCVGSFVNDGLCVPSNNLNLNCGPGTQSQKYVISQIAAYGGTQCTFNQNQTQIIPCTLAPCPIDCVGSFGAYTTCTKNCAGGKKERVYTVTKPAENGGKSCPNNTGDKEIIDCNPQPCPINCEGEFIDFKPCSKECGTDGILLQKYNITKPAQYGGQNCDYANNDVKSIPCNRQACPTYPENTAIKEALKDSNTKIQNIRYDIINRQEELDLLTNKFNRLNKNISKIKITSNYIPDDKILKFY